MSQFQGCPCPRPGLTLGHLTFFIFFGQIPYHAGPFFGQMPPSLCSILLMGGWEGSSHLITLHYPAIIHSIPGPDTNVSVSASLLHHWLHLFGWCCYTCSHTFCIHKCNWKFPLWQSWHSLGIVHFEVNILAPASCTVIKARFFPWLVDFSKSFLQKIINWSYLEERVIAKLTLDMKSVVVEINKSYN